jgi:hypothetical protein
MDKEKNWFECFFCLVSGGVKEQLGGRGRGVNQFKRLGNDFSPRLITEKY